MAEEAKTLTLAQMHASPGYFIRRAHQLSTAAFADVTRESGLTSIQFAALVAINNVSDADAATVSDIISIDRTTVGQVLARLEARGLLVRKHPASDRRRKSLNLTAAGKAKIAEVSALIGAVEERIVGMLSDRERTMLKQLMNKMANTTPQDHQQAELSKMRA